MWIKTDFGYRWESPSAAMNEFRSLRQRFPRFHALVELAGYTTWLDELWV